MATPVTPVAGLVNMVATGGMAVIAVPENPSGGFITNPAAAADQGLGAPENLYVSPVGDATLVGNNTTFVIEPGGSWPIIAGQTTRTSVNAASDGHKFSVVYWP